MLRAKVLLAQSANQTAAGETNVLGLGWSVAAPAAVPPHAILIFLDSDVPEVFDASQVYFLRLVAEDGSVAVTTEMPGGINFIIRLDPLGMHPRIPGVEPRASLTVQIGGTLALKPGNYRYEFGSIEGESESLLGHTGLHVQASLEEHYPAPMSQLVIEPR